MDPEMPTRYPVVFKESGRREVRWKVCALSLADLRALEEVVHDFFKERNELYEAGAGMQRRGSKKWTALLRPASAFAVNAADVSDSSAHARGARGGAASAARGGRASGDRHHLGALGEDGAPGGGGGGGGGGAAAAARRRSRGGRRGGDGGGGGDEDDEAAAARRAYLAALVAVNAAVIGAHVLQLPLWHPLFLAALAVANVALGVGAPLAPFARGGGGGGGGGGADGDGEAAAECLDAWEVPLVHAADLAPLVKAVKTLHFTSRRRARAREGSDAASDEGARRGPPLAGVTVPRAEGRAAGDLGAPQRSWANGRGPVFNVRGPNYLSDRIKITSGDALYDLVGCDFYATPMRVSNLADAYINLSNVAEGAPVPSLPDVPSVLILNLQLPSSAPEVFNMAEDGPTYHVVFYFAITQATVDALKDPSTASPAVRLFAQWCSRQADDDEFRGRFKAMVVVENWSATGLANNFKSWNGKPVLVTKTGQTFAGKPATAGGKTCLEMAVNVHKFRFAAKKVLSALMDRLQNLVVHIGFTIEGRASDELPECMLATAGLFYPSPDEVDELPTGIDDDD